MKLKFRTLMTVLAASLGLAGCQKSIGLEEGLPIRFALSAENGTKGELINTDGSDKALADKGVTSFAAAAYNGESPVFTTPDLDPANVETVSYTSGSWTMSNTYYWPQKTDLTFFTYANLPTSGSSVAITSTGQTLTHEMLSAVADQKDILLGYYTGNGSGIGTAEIRFRHPLTAVIFRKGDIGDEVITDITLSGLGASGTVTMDADGKIGAWQAVDDYTATSSQSKEGGLDVNATTNVIGEPFILIPQDLAENGVTIIVECESGLTIETTIESGEWKAQRTNRYTLKIKDKSLTVSSITVEELVNESVKVNW